jgi:hypothetical protein
MQNKVVQYILDMKPRTKVNYEVLNSLNMLTVPDRVIQLRFNHVFNIFNCNAPPYMTEQFSLNEGNTREPQTWITKYLELALKI